LRSWRRRRLARATLRPFLVRSRRLARRGPSPKKR
jgi:hypothetical protein